MTPAFTARSSTPKIDLGTRLTLIPTEPPDGPPRPVIPTGIDIPLEEVPRPESVRVVDAATADELTRELVIARSDGRLFRLTPQKPSEGGGWWQPGRGMTVWVVRWQVEG